MARTVEPHLNLLLAQALGRRHPRWKVSAEQTRRVRGQAGLRPDILVEHHRGQPLVIETEVDPASTVEQDAASRLGMTLEPGGKQVEQAAALRIPASLTYVNQPNLEEAVEQADYQYAAISLNIDRSLTRWPRAGWLKGGVDDLANLCENIALSEQALAAGLARLEEAVGDISYGFRSQVPQGALDKMAAELRQEDGEQTSRMAAAVILNAVTFYTALSGRGGFPTLDEMRAQRYGRLQRSTLLENWDKILRVNYWPIFHIAKRLLLPIPLIDANLALQQAAAAAEELTGIGVTTMHDLAGRMFQQLITDRKYLATFYTLPPSAAMIAELAAAKLELDWADEGSVADLQIADLACGTGTLLSAAYQAVRSRHRRAGGDDAKIHARMIERGLIAADVMPQAAHLTASMLSSAHPSIPFDNTRVHTLPYGVDAKGTHIGSLELLGVNALASLFPTGEQQAHGAGGQGSMKLQRESLDLVIMNPPFTRPTNHESAEVPRPDFAGLGNDEEAQQLMGARLRQIHQLIASEKLLLDPVGNGNAGLASYFADLAHLKLKEGGVMALVLPFSAIAGRSWKKLRAMLAGHYTDVTVVSIAAAGSTDRAFSADTGMADAVITAKKRSKKGGSKTLFVNLHRRPESIPEAVELARSASRTDPEEEGGYLTAGDDLAGVWMQGSLVEDGGMAAVSQPGVAVTMARLPGGRLVLPRRGRPLRLPMTTLAQVGREGLVHRDIGVKPGAMGDIRGPFEIHPMSGVPDYPVLWAHSAGRERRLVVEPDSEGRVRRGQAVKAAEVWKRSAARLHFNLDFRLNSQSLAACLTAEPVIGGAAWPSFEPLDERWTLPLLLWANTTLGLMCFWWTGARQHQGRARLTITALPDLPVLDPRRLGGGRLEAAEGIFDDFRRRELLPANEAYRDQARRRLDRAVLVDLLGLPEEILGSLDVLRRQWCSEPSVHGGKSTRPD